MSAVASILGMGADHPRRTAFLKWQCRVRQMAMRDNYGRPDDGIMPEVTLAGADAPMGHIITLLNKAPVHSLTAEMKHMAAKTFDPAQRRDQALRFFSATYYQKHDTFSDLLTATFPPGSAGAETIRNAERCTLRYEAFAQVYALDCKVWRLAGHNPLHQATLAHNLLFNPGLPPDTEVLGFEPDWDASTAEPEVR